MHLLISLFYLAYKFKNWKIVFLINIPILFILEISLPLKDVFDYYPRFFVILFFYILIVIKYKFINPEKNINFILNLFIFSLFISLINVTNFYKSFTFLIHFISILLLFKIFLFFFRYNKNAYLYLKKFIKSGIIALIFFLIYIFICTLIKYGSTDGYETFNKIYFGHANFYQIFIWSYLGITLFFLFYYFESKKLFFLLFLSLVFIFLLIGKRTYVSILFIGLFISFLLYLYDNFNIKKIILLGFSFIFFFFLLGNQINKFLEVRKASTEEGFFNEGRWFEIIAFKTEVIDKNKTFELLFGKEIFNSQGVFFKNSEIGWLENVHHDRILHSDLTNLLYGAGIVGVFLYYSFILLIGIKVRNNFKKIKKKDKLLNSLRYVFWGIYCAFIFNQLSDGILYFTNRVYIFIFFAVTLGISKNEFIIRDKVI